MCSSSSRRSPSLAPLHIQPTSYPDRKMQFQFQFLLVKSTTSNCGDGVCGLIQVAPAIPILLSIFANRVNYFIVLRHQLPILDLVIILNLCLRNCSIQTASWFRTVILVLIYQSQCHKKRQDQFCFLFIITVWGKICAHEEAVCKNEGYKARIVMNGL